MQIIGRSLGRVPLLEIHDDIDHSGAEEFHAAVKDALDGGEHVIVDLAGCRYVDSGGLAVILLLTEGIRPGGWLAIAGAGRNLLRSFHLVGLDAEPAVRLFPDLAAAERELAVDVC